MVKLITLDPGHFHAALVQKTQYEGVDPKVHVYAPEGDDVAQHLKTIERFNTRENQPTHWEEIVYTGDDFAEKMLEERAGNVVVLAGKNALKTDYIYRSVAAGLNVLADKPMAVVPANYPVLEKAFETAKANGVLLYDIMTERHEITTILQRELSLRRELFGEIVTGTPEEPAITKESVHCFSKIVAGVPLKRPQWFYDIRQQGEGLVDVSTHLVDLIQWEVFPDKILNPSDVTMLSARRWPTPLTPEQFKKTTGAETFPDYLHDDVKDGVLQVFANGEFTYTLCGIHAKVSVIWDFEAPPGGGDSHYSIMRGTQANLVIRQGEAQKFKPVLYVEKRPGMDPAGHDATLRSVIDELEKTYPGIGLERDGEAWIVTIPNKYNVGHEAHFGQVTEDFLKYLESGSLPDREVPNMLAKYHTIMQAYEFSHRESRET